jgi:hypothetical protein
LLLQEWREVYARPLHARTGKWTHRGYDFHVFSFGFARAIAGEKAVFTYQSQDPPRRTIVCPHERRLPAVELIDGALPDLFMSGHDIFVWPEDLAWTMAFTHEDGSFGPYFSRRESIDRNRGRLNR